METPALQTAEGQWIARRLIIARSFSDRLRGVLKHGTLQTDTALLITPCSSIHTFGVACPLDAIFLSAQLRILRLVPHIAPWRVQWAPRGTKHVLELRAGTLNVLHLQPGTFVCVRSSTDEPAERATAAALPPCNSAHLRFSLRIPRESNQARITAYRPCERRPQSQRR